jgi:acetoacetyl-CoA synthetase
LLWRFSGATSHLHGCAPDDYAGLHAWSTADRGAFWSAVWDATGVIGDRGEVDFIDGGAMLADRFFPEARLNYAENLLRLDGDAAAIIFRSEDGIRRSWSWRELRVVVSKLQRAFEAHGLVAGDRVAAVLPNGPEAIAAMLATASMGAVWCACSPDFGAAAIHDRLGQVAPKLLLATDGYCYGGKRFAIGETIRNVAERLGAERAIVVDSLGDAAALAAAIPSATTFTEFVDAFPAGKLTFLRLPFNHPLFVLFSSGTTGRPKCIVHGAGGTLLQHLKEHQLHCDIRPGDRVFYFTTLGWMMWNWLGSALASGATLCLYDGSPAYPSAEHLFAIADEERLTHFGTSARFIDSLRKSGVEPRYAHDLSRLRMILSTGSPLSADAAAYVYSGVATDVHLASISGGTDIISCFVLGVPTLPVYAGEIQAPGLGMAVEVLDTDARPTRGRGELVCTRAFPSMPVAFWNDADGSRYRAAYFDHVPGVWAHGDFAEWTDHGGMIIHGRSDATLNPGGVRIGTAEIYGVVERLPEIAAALCVSQEWDGDTRIVMFLQLVAGATLDDPLRSRIKTAIRLEASPRHVPAVIVAIADLPRTRSGKLSELAVREMIHGRPVQNIDALANPHALALFTDLPELR